MEDKNKRLAIITNIIQNEEVSSQEMLLKLLLANGCTITQATLSRDLKLLKVFKHPTHDGRYRYALPQHGSASLPAGPSSSFDGFVSIEFTGNLAVIKTLPAFAQPISQIIDDASLAQVAGTIAGNDTILLVVRNGFSPKNVVQALRDRFPELSERINY